MTITGDNQFEWRGYKAGDPDNTGVAVVKWDPGQPTVERTPLNRPGAHGTILPRSDLLRGRTPSLELELEHTTRAGLQTRIDALNAATVPVSTGDENLDFQILGTPRRYKVRPTPARWLWTEESDLGLWIAGVVVEFYAQDPREYAGSATVTVLS